MPSRSAKERIHDILNAIDSIQRRTTGMNFDQFSQDETIVKAVLYDLIVIGEASIIFLLIYKPWLQNFLGG